MSTPPINQSLRARAYENFRQQILQANVQPGQFVSQRELMQLLDMPLGAVRELIPRLEAEGLLRTVPQRGLQIAHVDLKLIHNAFQLRAMLEREAALHFVQVVSDADLAERAKSWKPRESEYGSGAIWKYAQLVGPARYGALTTPGADKEKSCYADI